MNVTPEIVRAEMDYRMERALKGAAVEFGRGRRRARRSWFHRSRDHGADEPRTAKNGAPLVA
jgi:hypothetical protein